MKAQARIPLVIAAVVVYGSSMGQDPAAGDASNGRWSIGARVTPGIGHRSLIAAEDNSTTRTIIDLRNDLEDPRFSPSAAVIAAFERSPHWAIEAGIGYSLLGYETRINTDDLTFGDMIDPRRGFVYGTDEGPLPERFIFRDDFHYLDLSLRAVWMLGHGRWRWISGLGVTTGFLLQAGTTLIKDYGSDGRERSTEEAVDDFEPFGLFPEVSTGASWSLNDRLELRAEPRFKYGLCRLIDAPITGHLWSAGIGFGCMFRL